MGEIKSMLASKLEDIQRLLKQLHLKPDVWLVFRRKKWYFAKLSINLSRELIN
jgi:hypothetical protein